MEQSVELNLSLWEFRLRYHGKKMTTVMLQTFPIYLFRTFFLPREGCLPADNIDIVCRHRIVEENNNENKCNKKMEWKMKFTKIPSEEVRSAFAIFFLPIFRVARTYTSHRSHVQHNDTGVELLENRLSNLSRRKLHLVGTRHRRVAIYRWKAWKIFDYIFSSG